MAEPVRADRPGDREVDLNALIGKALFDGPPEQAALSFQHRGQVARVVEVVSALLEGRDAVLAGRTAERDAARAEADGLYARMGTVDDLETQVRSLKNGQQYALDRLGEARAWLSHLVVAAAGSWDPNRVDGCAAEAKLRIEQLRRDARPRCSCNGDPVECDHEAARGVAEAELSGARSALEQARTLNEVLAGRLAARLEKQAKLLSELSEELAWLKSASDKDKAELGRIVGFEDAVRTVRESLGRPAAQEAADPSEPSLGFRLGWKSAMEEIDAWATRQAERALEHNDQPGEQAYRWCSTAALVRRNDPTMPGRLADRTEAQAPVAAQEAGEPPQADDLVLDVGSLPQEIHEAAVPRVWRGSVPEEPPVGTHVSDCDGDHWKRAGNGWDPVGQSVMSCSWEQLVGYLSPLTEVLPEVSFDPCPHGVVRILEICSTCEPRSASELVREFHVAFGLPIADASRTHNGMRAKLIREEAQEASDALEAGGLPAIAQELADLDYVTHGAALTLGIDLDRAVAEVHRANMSKLGGDGHPVMRADGKVLKGPNYRAPDMTVALPAVPSGGGPDAAA